jgi:nicotinate phosphoribosyltransferase
MRIHGSLIETQLIESALLNIASFQTLIATKAARVRLSTGKSSVLEFGLRRAQGIDGALSASRAAFIGGAGATSNTLAGMRYGIPVKGTMAHSWVMAFSNEREAFEAYAETYLENCTLLRDPQPLDAIRARAMTNLDGLNGAYTRLIRENRSQGGAS